MTLASKKFSELITFTRASTATYVNSVGLVASAAVDTPRFNYDPATLAAKGLLIEPAATNLCLHSDDHTNAAWVKTTCTAAKTATGPDGVANSASTLTATAANATSLQAITSASSARITSCWIKRRTGTGAIEMTQDNGSTWAAVTVTSSWARVNIAAATLANPTVGLRIVTNGDAIDVALFQHETGSARTSAIPTTTATVTRSADNASITGTAFSDWFNATEGTVYIEANIPLSGSEQALVSFNDGTSSERMRMYSTSGGNAGFLVTDGGVTQASISGGALSSETDFKVVGAFKLNDFAICLNGGTVTTDTSGTLPTIDRLFIGRRADGLTLLNGHIKNVRFYPSRLTDAQLQDLTT